MLKATGRYVDAVVAGVGTATVPSHDSDCLDDFGLSGGLVFVVPPGVSNFLVSYVVEILDKIHLGPSIELNTSSCPSPNKSTLPRVGGIIG